jgi:hypothetical protein
MPGAFAVQLRQLFGAMQTGGYFGVDQIPRFDGGLFDTDEVLELDARGLRILSRISALDWGSIEPAILNARPTWLQNAHDRLDEAVFAAYGWPRNLSDEEILRNLLTLNRERA